MKMLHGIILLFPLMLLSEQVKSQVNEPFVVLELFTSQGCSSCPSADANASRIRKQSMKSGQHVYVLSYHVDYWDRLGWKDPFSNGEYSERQRFYANNFRSNRVYTPQIVVNGEEEFVGSSETKAQDAIQRMLSRESQTSIVASAIISNNRAHLKLNFKGRLKDTHIQIALVENGVTTHIKSGENGGKVLEYNNIVQSFKTLLPSENLETVVLIPDHVKIENSYIIVFVQEVATLKILGASSVKL